MNQSLETESLKLAQSWNQHDPEKLRNYLVSSVEDPRINLQSVLTRHFLASLLFGPGLDELKSQELLFGVFSGWLSTLLPQKLHADDWHAILHALDHQSDNAEGLELPGFLVRAYPTLPAEASGISVPNYIQAAFATLRATPADAVAAVTATISQTFESLWAGRLVSESGGPLSVCEVACGSANDYRFIESYGLGRFLEYSGFDISEKNIANAKAMFPEKRFAVGNAFALALPESAVDACYFHDLLEHLSPEGLDQAIGELCRITRRSICAGLFSAWEGPDHVVRPTDDYYFSTLSISRLEQVFGAHGFTIRPVHIDSWLRKRFPGAEYHNPNAYTVFCDRRQ